MSKFCSNIFEIPPKGNIFTSQQNTEKLPLIHKNYYLLNVGRVPVRAEVVFGNSIGWSGTATGPIEVRPGEEAILDMTKNLHFLTAVKVYNEYSLRALVHVGADDGSDWNKTPKTNLKLDIDSIFKNIIKFAPINIPHVGDKLESIMEFFWPQKGSIWGIVINDVAQINTKTKSDLRQLRTRLVNLNTLLEHKEASSGVSISYQFMQLMEEMVSFEKKFIVSHETVDSDRINCFSLPYYSLMVSLKMCLYQFGVINRFKVSLNDEQVRRLLLLSKKLIGDKLDGAISTVERICAQAINNEYATCDPQLAYDSLAAIRTYCGIAGLEFIPYWNGILTNPFWKKEAYNDVVLFSPYYGRPSPQLYKQLVPEHVKEPLEPSVINGVRNKMERIDMWIKRKDSRALPKIGGLSIYYQNGDSCSLGRVSQESKSFYFKDTLLIQITAWGVGAIDCIELIFSDGRKEICGSKVGLEDNFHKFQLEHHYICGIFLANDVPSLQGQAANIAVSFQPIIES